MIHGKTRLRLAGPTHSPRLLNPLTTEEDNHPLLPLNQNETGSSKRPRLTPNTRRRATGIATAIIEVIAGRRRLQQLEHLMTPNAIRTIRKLRNTPFSTDLRIRSLHVQSPEPGIMEVAIHLHQRDISRAAAIRLSETTQGWICTRFETSLIPTIITKAS